MASFLFESQEILVPALDSGLICFSISSGRLFSRFEWMLTSAMPCSRLQHSTSNKSNQYSCPTALILDTKVRVEL